MFPKVESYGNYLSENRDANAVVFTDAKGNKFFFSYKTLIAFKTNRGKLVIRKNDWKTTTGKHLNWINPDKKIRVNKNIFEKKFKEIFGNRKLPSI
jgi:hypothetical protein